MATDNDRLNEALAELEAVGIGTLTNDTWSSTTITPLADPNDPNFQPSGTSVDGVVVNNDQIYISNGTGIGEWSVADASQTILQMGALTLSPQENGDVEIVMDADGLREEYHITADKVRNFLRSIADVVVEGKEA